MCFPLFHLFMHFLKKYLLSARNYPRYWKQISLPSWNIHSRKARNTYFLRWWEQLCHHSCGKCVKEKLPWAKKACQRGTYFTLAWSCVLKNMDNIPEQETFQVKKSKWKAVTDRSKSMSNASMSFRACLGVKRDKSEGQSSVTTESRREFH